MGSFVYFWVAGGSAPPTAPGHGCEVPVSFLTTQLDPKTLQFLELRQAGHGAVGMTPQLRGSTWGSAAQLTS